MIYAFDTNIVSYILKEDKQIIQKYNEEYDKGNDFVIPPIVYYEVKRGLVAANAEKKISKFELMCSEFLEDTIDFRVLNEAVKIYAALKPQGQLIEDADIFIAAYCIVNDYTLITNNSFHFERIANLKFVNWK